MMKDPKRFDSLKERTFQQDQGSWSMYTRQFKQRKLPHLK